MENALVIDYAKIECATLARLAESNDVPSWVPSEWLELIELARQAAVRPIYEPALDVLTDRLLELGLIKPLFHSPKNKKRVQRLLRRDALKWADAVHPPRSQWGIYVNGVRLEDVMTLYNTRAIDRAAAASLLGYDTETSVLNPGRITPR